MNPCLALILTVIAGLIVGILLYTKDNHER